MKRLLLVLAFIGSAAVFQSCEGDPGPPGADGADGVESEVFELRNVNFTLNNNNEYTIYGTLNPNIFDSDNILIYRLSGLIDANTPIWQLIPRTLFLNEGELDYDYDFSKEDFTIYAGGTFNVGQVPQYINNQTFRIVIIPGYFSKKAVDKQDYNAVLSAYGIDDSHIKVIQPIKNK
ncbi:hypothetical protein [Flavobacterium sp.]|uniref:hypothetical protein n=1 Tax=Flavobacterium sp. TaxID=239 RepID=UPI002610CB75|nr:hypothetical protein [Flavobacterium sp.]